MRLSALVSADQLVGWIEILLGLRSIGRLEFASYEWRLPVGWAYLANRGGNLLSGRRFIQILGSCRSERRVFSPARLYFENYLVNQVETNDSNDRSGRLSLPTLEGALARAIAATIEPALVWRR